MSMQARLLEERSYVRYLGALWRSTAAFGWYSVGLTVFRRIRLLRLIVRIVHGFWLALQTGTVVLLLLPLVLVFVLLTLLAAIFMLIGGALSLGRMRRVMTQRMQGKTVILLSTSGGDAEDSGAFFRGQLSALGALADVVTVVRSPYLIRCAGYGGRGFYWSYRRERARLYLARTLGFFALRRIAVRAGARVILVV